MTILFWVLGIHFVELSILIIFLLIRKNKKLEEIISTQQDQLDSITILINRMNDNFQQLDEKLWISEDQELKTLFEEIKDIRNILNSLK